MILTRTGRKKLNMVVTSVACLMIAAGAWAQADIDETIAQLDPQLRPVIPSATPSADVELVFTGAQKELRDLTRFNGALYFIHDGNLMRVADGETRSDRIDFGRGYANSLHVFDEALYFTGIAPEGRWTRSLHKLDASGAVTSISGTEDIDEFVVYRDDIYYLTQTPRDLESCGGTLVRTSYGINRVRVDGSGSDISRTNLRYSECLSNVSSLKSTSAGLAFTVVAGAAGQGQSFWPETTLHLLRDPVFDPSVPDQSYLYGILHYEDSNFSDPYDDFEAFDGYLFYRGEHRFESTGRFSLGPFDDPGRGPRSNSGIVPDFETELYRGEQSGGAIYYNLRQLNSEELESVQNTIGPNIDPSINVSSKPRDFVVTSSGLYFTALTNVSDTQFGVDELDLYRVPFGTATPERIVLGSAGRFATITDRRVLGESGGRLWVVADIGNGLDVHYLNENVAIPMSLPASIGGPMQDFIALRDWAELPGGIAIVGMDGRGIENVYRITPTVAAPNNAVTSMMTVGGESYATRPGLEVSTKQGLEYQCTVTNSTTDSLTNVSMRLDRRRLSDSPDEKNGKRIVVKTCTAALLGVSEVLTCAYKSRPRANTWKHDCVTKLTNGQGARVKVRDSAYVTRPR